MLECLVENMFVVFAGKVFQQIIGIPIGTNCAPLLAHIFHIDDELSINNPDFENYLGQMYPPELEIKDTTESNTSSSYFDLPLSIGRDGRLHTSLYDKHDDFNYYITNFPFLSSNIPSSPAYGVFISQLIRYATLLLPTWIYSCQSVGTVNFTLPFTTSVTISISILQSFRS